MTDTADRARRTISDYLMLDTDRLIDSATFDDLGADSLDAAEVILKLEIEFGITIPPESEADFQTLGGLISYLESVVS